MAVHGSHCRHVKLSHWVYAHTRAVKIYGRHGGLGCNFVYPNTPEPSTSPSSPLEANRKTLTKIRLFESLNAQHMSLLAALQTVLDPKESLSYLNDALTTKEK